MQIRTEKTGFTLIELLLVLVIIGTLAAVVIPRFTARSKEAKITACKADIANLQLLLDAFEVDCGRYPTNEEGLAALVVQPANAQDWHGPYLTRGVPKDPWGNPFVYHQPGQHNPGGYDLYSFGPDGQEGTSDDVDNWTER